MTGLADLPDDVLEYILGKLPHSFQCRAKAVSKLWKARLSSIKTRTKEGWIIVNRIDHLLWYNVNQNQWLKNEMWISSLSLPIQEPRLCCVFQELLFFCEAEKKQPHICFWNSITNKAKLLEIDPVPGTNTHFPGTNTLQFGAYTDNTTGKLNLLLFDYVELVYMSSGEEEFSEDEMRSRLFRCEVEGEGGWEELFFLEPCCDPNFNSLTPSNRVVTFVGGGSTERLHFFNVDKSSFETLDFVSDLEFDAYCQETPLFQNGRVHFPSRGCFVVGEFEDHQYLGVLRYNPKVLKFELVSELPEELHSIMYRDKYQRAHYNNYFICSDGEENIWSLMLGRSIMIRYNVVSKAWVTLPCILPWTGYDVSVQALHTSF